MNLQQIWYQSHPIAHLLKPFSWVYRGIMAARSAMYRRGIKKTVHFPVPVIVVGNITVGGVGKTPLVICLANWLKQQGWRPGLVSRGYGGSATRNPVQVGSAQLGSDPGLVGDEAVLLVEKTLCPMVVSKDRVAATAALLRDYDCNIVISDDGLQHLALGRDIEIAVIDGERRLGNGFCLPAGPLREPAKRLAQVDFIVTNGAALANEWSMQLKINDIYQIINPLKRLVATAIGGKQLHAVAAIGNPQRFFNSLTAADFQFIPHSFPDHYFFRPQDIDFGLDSLVIMTEKDAVKCRRFADERHWCLPITASMPESFFTTLLQQLAG
jgi:tetraacyldisaccharide 4'-kinase